jgi:hypothetical protein
MIAKGFVNSSPEDFAFLATRRNEKKAVNKLFLKIDDSSFPDFDNALKNR